MSDAMEMSEALSKGLQDQVNATLADRGGGFLTGYVGIVQYIDEEGIPCWSFISMPDQVLSMSLGMLQIANKITETQVNNIWELDRDS